MRGMVGRGVGSNVLKMILSLICEYPKSIFNIGEAGLGDSGIEVADDGCGWASSPRSRVRFLKNDFFIDF